MRHFIVGNLNCLQPNYGLAENDVGDIKHDKGGNIWFSSGKIVREKMEYAFLTARIYNPALQKLKIGLEYLQINPLLQLGLPGKIKFYHSILLPNVMPV